MRSAGNRRYFRPEKLRNQLNRGQLNTWPCFNWCHQLNFFWKFLKIFWKIFWNFLKIFGIFVYFFLKIFWKFFENFLKFFWFFLKIFWKIQLKWVDIAATSGKCYDPIGWRGWTAAGDLCCTTTARARPDTLHLPRNVETTTAVVTKGQIHSMIISPTKSTSSTRIKSLLGRPSTSLWMFQKFQYSNSTATHGLHENF